MYTLDAEQQIEAGMHTASKHETAGIQNRLGQLIELRNKAKGVERERLNALIDDAFEDMLDAEGY